jgi:lipopolysaccharide export LptBFGC system permease protein LptF
LFTNPSSRFFNTAAFTSITIFTTLITWGVLFFLQKLALGGVVLGELAIIMPLVILFIVTYYIYNKKVI